MIFMGSVDQIVGCLQAGIKSKLSKINWTLYINFYEIQNYM